MALHPGRQAAIIVANYTGGPLPHLLTLTGHGLYEGLLRISFGLAVIFFPVPVTSRLPLFQESGALWCPDFPPHRKNGGATRQPAVLQR